MHPSDRIPYERLLAEARERFEEAEDFTVSVEEEFALLDRETLDLVNRFEEVQAAAQGTRARAEPRRRADRVGGRGEDGQAGVVRGRPRRARRAARRAHRARRAARARPRRDGDAPLVELAGPADHRHPALPAERRDPQVRRLAQQHVRRPHPRRDPRRRPGGPRHDRAAELAAGAPRGLGELAVPRGRRHRAPLGEDPGVHPLLPALRRPGRVPTRGTSTRTTSASSTTPARSTSRRSSGGASART